MYCKCIAFAPSLGKVEGLLSLAPISDKPFEVVHIDHEDIADSRVPGKKYVLVVKEAFTKFVKIYQTISTTSAEAISCLKSYFSTYSKPKVIISDRGTCFITEAVESFLKNCEVKHSKIAKHSNGQVKRVNRVLAPMIAKFSNHELGKKWSRVLEEVEFAINYSVHKTTGQTPSKILFGIAQRGKVDDMIEKILEDEMNASWRGIEVTREMARKK